MTVSAAADTLRLPTASNRVVGDDSNPPSTEPSVAARLVDGEPEPFPYTKVRDWIALIPQADLGDGAFRLYCISRSVIWENAKGGPPPRPVVEITYEEYAQILGRSARTISRFAEDLFKVGLWEELERASRSIRVPGKARPQVQTVLTIRVHDHPREPWAFSGPTKTWDVLSAIRDAKRRAQEDQALDHVDATRPPISAGQCALTDVSAQIDQPEHGKDLSSTGADVAEVRVAEAVSPGRCAPTNLSGHIDQAGSAHSIERCGAQDRSDRSSPARTGDSAGPCDTTDLSPDRTNLSEQGDVVADQPPCGDVPKKKVEEEKPSLPPTPSRGRQPESIDDELAMFSSPTVELVGHLYAKTVTTPGLQPLSVADRAGLARRIESRLAEGWSLTRIRSVLTGGSLVGVKMPGRLWAGRLDDMPAFRVVPGRDAAAESIRDRPANGPRERPVVINDCSAMPDPNEGKARYEVPDGRGVRMTVRWAESSRIRPWCGRCSSDSRCLRPNEPGSLLRPCLDCHPEPHAFPPEPEQGNRDTGSSQELCETPRSGASAGHQKAIDTPTPTRPQRRPHGAQDVPSVPAEEGTRV